MAFTTHRVDTLSELASAFITSSDGFFRWPHSIIDTIDRDTPDSAANFDCDIPRFSLSSFIPDMAS